MVGAEFRLASFHNLHAELLRFFLLALVLERGRQITYTL